jgi:L-ascorbate metabolism protein UlaG (beta-lactamase superfamily)
MNESEAATLAARHQFGLVIPTHYDLCVNNAGSLPDFVRELKKADPSRAHMEFFPGEQKMLSSMNKAIQTHVS